MARRADDRKGQGRFARGGPQQACSKSVTSTSRGTTKHSNRSTTRQSIRSSGFFRPTKTRHGSRGTASRTASCSGKAMPTSSTTRSTAWDWRNPSARARASIPGQAPGSAAVNASYTGSFRLRRLGQRFRRRLRNRRELDGRMDQLRSAEHGILIAPSAARRPLIGKPHSGHRPLCGLPFRRESGKRPNVSIPDAEVRPDSQDINSESLYPVTTATSRPDTRSPVPLEVPELG